MVVVVICLELTVARDGGLVCDFHKVVDEFIDVRAWLDGVRQVVVRFVVVARVCVMQTWSIQVGVCGVVGQEGRIHAVVTELEANLLVFIS